MITESHGLHKTSVHSGHERPTTPLKFEEPVWPEYHQTYYGAFVRDPDGNNVEAVCHAPEE
jgi:hypothetical protein